MTNDTEWLGIVECARALESGSIGCEELVRHLIQRIRRYDGVLHAFLDVYADEAIADARHCDSEIRQNGRSGPLHGIPVAVKDIFDIAGKPTTCHSRIRADHLASRDAKVVAMLKAAGAIVIGKTALHEFATGGPSLDLPWPPARNPWNPEVHPGGSSSGSGVALAAGFVPFALGTDTGGSVRNPASACGITGMKPTYGAVSVEGCFPLSHSLDHVGPMTRGVLDNAVALSCLLEPWAAKRMGCTSGMRAFNVLDSDMRGDLRGMRIGVITCFHAGQDANLEIAAATESAISLLSRLGAKTGEMALSPLAIYTECGRTLLQAESFAIHAHWLRSRPRDYGDRGRRRLMSGAMISSERYVRALQVRTHLVREFDDAMREFDVAVAVSSLEHPCAIGDEALLDKTYDRQARMPFNVTGSPAISIPIGFSSSGLPIGLQITARSWNEAAVYRAALGLESALGLSMRPPIDKLSDRPVAGS